MSTNVTAAGEELFVLCWAYENRFDEKGGVGFSFHTTKEKADEWVKDGGKKIENFQPGIAVYFVCGKGLANSNILSAKSKEKIKEDGSLFIPYEGLLSDMPAWLKLTEGVWQGKISQDFADYMNSRDDDP